MKCQRCAHGVQETARFCEQCGSALRSDDPAFELSYAHRLEATGDLQSAAREYERMLDSVDLGEYRAMVLKHLGNLSFRMGHLRRARLHLAAAVEIEPDNAAFLHDLAVVQYHVADFDAAVESLREALRHDPGLHLAYFWLGNALYHRGDRTEATKAFQTLIERYPNFTIARFHLGVIFAREGKRDAAEREFRRVLLKNPEDTAARYYI